MRKLTPYESRDLIDKAIFNREGDNVKLLKEAFAKGAVVDNNPNIKEKPTFYCVTNDNRVKDNLEFYKVLCDNGLVISSKNLERAASQEVSEEVMSFLLEKSAEKVSVKDQVARIEENIKKAEEENPSFTPRVSKGEATNVKTSVKTTETEPNTK